jgi:AraC-like DNA-binding protein
MQILPSKELQPFIKHYLFLESEGKIIKKLRLFSDGNMGIVFSFGDNLITKNKNNELIDSLPNSFLYGQISQFKDLYLQGEVSLIVVVLQPSGINQLIGISADELLDKIIRIEDLFGCQGLEIQEKLAKKVAFQSKLTLLNTFFIELTAKKNTSNQWLIHASLDFIVKNKGNVSIHQLVKYMGYTERHLERKFMETVGLSPKKFSNIIKLHSFLKYLKVEPKNLTIIAYEAGYADQSHLIKEFKKYTGITPTEYVSKASKLAINFMELNSTVEQSQMSDLYNL